MKVSDVMTRDVITVPRSASLKEAASVLVQRDISGVPVVDGGKVVGVFSERDLLFKEQGQPDGAHWLTWLTDPLAVADRPKLEARVVGEAMTSPAVTVDATADIPAAARLMLAAGVSRLPVLHDGYLAGIVTRADLVRAFVRTDEEIALEIRDEIVGRKLWLDEDALEITVRDGNVSVSGALTDTVDPELLTRLIAQVPGVVSVETDLQLA
jgi:CBS domain-containing protein